MKPLVAVVGRPNVGKSTFFNRIVGKRISIVEDIPGVTRDRIYADAYWLGRAFTLVDTGGLDTKSDEPLLAHMRGQVDIAAQTADLVFFMLDGIQGITGEDKEVADYLRRSGKPVIPVVNKVDHISKEDALYDFYALGMGDPMPISSTQGLGLGDLLEKMFAMIPVVMHDDSADDGTIRVAIVGKPNAGKSSMVNGLLGEERVIVSDIPGTTRDAIDTELEKDGQRFILIDTAGMRRKRGIEGNTIERFSVVRSLTAVRRADVVILVVDANEGVSEQDAKIVGYAAEENKPIVIAVNKWDLVDKDDKTTEEFKKKIYSVLSFVTYAPIIFLSCKTGQRLHRLLPLVTEVYAKSRFRVTTGLLNDVISDAVAAFAPPSDNGRRLKILYATQAEEPPPTFVLFVNDAERLHYSYQRYLENHLRKTFQLDGTPIRIVARSRGEKEE